MPALAVNIIIVHPWDDVFRQGKALWKTTPLQNSDKIIKDVF
jgi:hypothetical protein